MYKGQDLIGKAVVSYDRGKQEGKITQLLLDTEQNRFLGFVVEEQGPGTEKILPLAQVQAIGADAVIISETNAAKPQDLEMGASTVRSNHFFQNQRAIYTDDGRALGTLVDMYVDTKTGKIVGYAAQGGSNYIGLSGGQTFVPVTGEVRISEAVVFVPAVTGEHMKEHAFLSQTPSPEGPQQAEPGAEKFLHATLHSKQEVRTVNDTKGRRARQAVYTDQGEILVAQGQIISDEIIAQAHTHKLENALIDATKSFSWGAHNLLDDEVWQNVRTRLEAEAKQVSSGIGKMWQRVKDSAAGRKFGAKTPQSHGEHTPSSGSSERTE